MKTSEARAEEEIERFRRQLLVNTSLLLKTATIHALTNAAFVRPIAEMIGGIREAVQSGEPLRIQTVGENFFINNEIVRLDFSSYESGQTLRKILKRMGAEEIAFVDLPSEAEIRAFLETFQKHFRSKTPEEILKAASDKITLRPIRNAFQGRAVEIDERQNLLRAYVVVALAIKAAITDTDKGRPPRIAQLRRAIHGLADASVDLGPLLIALTRFSTLSGETEFHLAATTALIMSMGRRLGLPRPALSELCLSAALHDLARAELPAAAESPLGEGELIQSLERVPLRTALRITASVNPEVVFYASAALEHTQPLAKEPSAVARMIAVPCAFDLLTQASPMRRAVPPDHALAVLRDHPDRFDPVVTELFAATVGLFPPGTIVRLSSGETALVVETPSDPSAYEQPIVKVIKDAHGLPADRFADLARTAVRIAESLEPTEADVSAAQFLFA